VRVDNTLIDYILKIIGKTREEENLKVGVSPRGALALFRAAQSLALLENRDYCTPDDIKRLSVPILSHRVIEKSHLQDEGIGASETIERILKEIKVPL
jgi:MoxR-like ATPase